MGEQRAILHSDLNSFYASVEMMLNPTLRGKAVAVCGSTEDRHGIVLAKSDKAKKAGIKTGMVNWEARRLCPDLIMVPPQYDEYLKYSKLTQAIYQRYTDLIEPFGMDECWLDVTGCRLIFGDAMTIAEEIRNTVREELGLTVSIGVSFNKVFAKLGSDLKKPDAITEIRGDNFREIVWPLAASEMIYCGRSTSAKLANYGIRTIGDVAKSRPEFLQYSGQKCETPSLDAETIKEQFLAAVNSLIADKNALLEDCRLIQKTLTDCSEIDAKLKNLKQEIEVVCELTKRCVEENAQSAQDQDAYAERYNGLVERYEKTKAAIDDLQRRKAERQAKADRIGAFMFELRERDCTITAFDDRLWLTTVEKATVYRNGRLVFLFQNGKEVTV